jgi:hypothetical protein
MFIKIVIKNWQCWKMLALVEESPHGVLTRAVQRAPLNWHNKVCIPRSSEAEMA